MKRPSGLMALTVLISIVLADLAHLAASPAVLRVEEQEQAKKETPRSEPDADGPAMVQGKTIDEWKAALKDRDPAVRKRAVEVLGERAVDPAVPAEEKSRLQIDVRSLMLSDKDRDVSQAAAFYADLFKVVDSPEMVERLLEEHRRAVDPTRRAIRLVDVQGRPVAGAVASTYFQRDADREPAFSAPEPIEAATSNARGLLALKLEIRDHLAGAGIYAIRPGQGSSSGRPAQGDARGDRQTDHDRDAPGLPRAFPDRQQGLARPGGEVSRRAGRSRLVARGVRPAGRGSPIPAPAVQQHDDRRARILPAARTGDDLRVWQ